MHHTVQIIAPPIMIMMVKGEETLPSLNLLSLCYFKYAEQNVTSSDKFGQVSCCEFHKCLSKALQRRSLIVYDKEWRAVMYPYSSPTR